MKCTYPTYVEVSGKYAYCAANEIAFRVTGSPGAERIELVFYNHYSTVASGLLQAVVDPCGGLADKITVTFGRGGDLTGFADALAYAAAKIREGVAQLGHARPRCWEEQSLTPVVGA